MSKDFDIGDVLSITTGKMLSLRGMDGIYDILNYMTGDSLFTHQLPRAADECRPYLLKAYPALADVEVPEINGHLGLVSWLTQFRPRTYSVEPIPQDDHSVKDPVTELQQMIGAEKVVVVAVDDNPGPDDLNDHGAGW